MKNIIDAIEAKLQEQKDNILFKQILIDDLKKQLAEAEKEIKHLKEQRECADKEITALLEQMTEAKRENDIVKGENNG